VLVPETKCPQFLFEDRLPAFESQFPESQAPPQGVLASISLTVVSGQLSRFHILLSVFASLSVSRVMRLASE
jgi:hypothetical protein